MFINFILPLGVYQLVNSSKLKIKADLRRILHLTALAYTKIQTFDHVVADNSQL
jgi:hypothetical protein